MILVLAAWYWFKLQEALPWCLQQLHTLTVIFRVSPKYSVCPSPLYRVLGPYMYDVVYLVWWSGSSTTLFQQHAHHNYYAALPNVADKTRKTSFCSIYMRTDNYLNLWLDQKCDSICCVIRSVKFCEANNPVWAPLPPTHWDFHWWEFAVAQHAGPALAWSRTSCINAVCALQQQHACTQRACLVT